MLSYKPSVVSKKTGCSLMKDLLILGSKNDHQITYTPTLLKSGINRIWNRDHVESDVCTIYHSWNNVYKDSGIFRI